MKNKIREANIYMIISKTFSGLNMNALKYLLPLWISPLTGVTLRCTFAALAFWIIGLFMSNLEVTFILVVIAYVVLILAYAVKLYWLEER